MKKTDLIALANKNNEEIKICKIIKKDTNLIQFVVDGKLSKPKEMLAQKTGRDIMEEIMSEMQISPKLYNIVDSSFADKKLHYESSDVMYDCFVLSYATHRPLVLSPDMIWLLISQTIAKYVDKNSDLLRDEIVSFMGKRDLIINTTYNLFSKEANWEILLQKLWNQIGLNTKV